MPFTETLEGFGLRLEPGRPEHAAGLAEFATPDLFQFNLGAIPFEMDARSFEEHLQELAVTGAKPYVMCFGDDCAGVSSFLDIRSQHRGLEIGSTWISKPFQGTFVNPAAKFLMLEYAFEHLGCERVQLKCDARNVHSQRAIEKLGAIKEGVLRKHIILPDGFVRDTVMYSIIQGEWPLVRANLKKRLAKLGRQR